MRIWIIEEVEGMHYVDTLEKVSLTTLEATRLLGDLIKCFKILNGFEDVDLNGFKDVDLKISSGLLTILCKSMAIIDSDTVDNSIADTDTHALNYRR